MVSDSSSQSEAVVQRVPFLARKWVQVVLFTVLLLIVLAWLGVIKVGVPVFFDSQRSSLSLPTGYSGSGIVGNDYSVAKETNSLSGIPAPSFVVGSTSTPVANMTETRKVTRNYLSTHVKDARAFATSVENDVTSKGGKVMNEYINDSETGSASGTIQLLIPNAAVDGVLKTIESSSIKIVDRQIDSYEITQEYTDIERRINQLEETLARVKKIYDKASTVDELLKVQSQMESVMAQIDSLKGRQSALNELSQNTQITVYFSTNEFNLPYVPPGKFEFGRMFKEAVRGLVSVLDSLLALAIWVIVFIPIWGGALLVGYILYILARRMSTPAKK